MPAIAPADRPEELLLGPELSLLLLLSAVLLASGFVTGEGGDALAAAGWVGAAGRAAGGGTLTVSGLAAGGLGSGRTAPSCNGGPGAGQKLYSPATRTGGLRTSWQAYAGLEGSYWAEGSCWAGRSSKHSRHSKHSRLSVP